MEARLTRILTYTKFYRAKLQRNAEPYCEILAKPFDFTV
jgi:hypothetical protein